MLAVVAAGVLGIAALIAWRSYRSLHSMLMEAGAPSDLLTHPEQTGVAGLQAVTFTTDDGLNIAGWYVKPANGAAIILTHGTWSDRSARLAELRLLAAAGYGVLAFDWPGLGQSQGEIRWNGQARRALTAAIDWLSGQPGVDANRIGGLGFSIGGYLMMQVAADDRRLRAVVVESPSPDFNRYVRHHSRWGFVGEWGGRMALRDTDLLAPAKQPLQLINRIAPRPLLLIVGTNDSNVPPEMVHWLFDAAKEPKELWIIEGASHGDYAAVAANEYTRRLAGFFAASLR